MQEEILSGHFQNVDDLLMEAIEALREKHAVAKALNRDEPGCSLKNNLAQFLLDSPFAGSDLDLERQQDYN